MREAILKHLWWATFSVALVLLLAHSFRLATVSVDHTSIFLLLLMLISPFIAGVRKIKFGDFEAEIDPKEVQKIKHDAEASLAQVVTPPESVPEIARTVTEILELANTDTVLALAKLRIELEKILRKVAFSLDHAVTVSTSHRAVPLAAIIRTLVTQEIIAQQTAGPLRDVMDICNRAIHGESIKAADAKAILEIGTGLLESLYWQTAELFSGRVIDETIINTAEVKQYQDMKYRLTTVIPLVNEPKRVVREVTQEQLEDFLEGYYEVAEFVVRLQPLEEKGPGEALK